MCAWSISPGLMYDLAMERYEAQLKEAEHRQMINSLPRRRRSNPLQQAVACVRQSLSGRSGRRTPAVPQKATP